MCYIHWHVVFIFKFFSLTNNSVRKRLSPYNEEFLVNNARSCWGIYFSAAENITCLNENVT